MKTFLFSILISALFAFNTQTIFAQYKPAKLQKQVQKLVNQKALSSLFAASNGEVKNIQISEGTDIEVMDYPFVNMITVSFEVVVEFVPIEGDSEPTIQTYLCHLSKYRSLKWNRVSFQTLKGEDKLHKIKELLVFPSTPQKTI